MEGSPMSEIARQVSITGRVQGVRFRNWTQERAEVLGLSGWVRNEPDGSVTALFAGPEAAVSRMIAALDQGPPAARVTQVAARPAPLPAEPGFRVLR